jgi:hypothetical protein
MGPVGASLLAKAVNPLHIGELKDRFREQARSHKVPWYLLTYINSPPSE